MSECEGQLSFVMAADRQAQAGAVIGCDCTMGRGHRVFCDGVGPAEAPWAPYCVDCEWRGRMVATEAESKAQARAHSAAPAEDLPDWVKRCAAGCGMPAALGDVYCGACGSAPDRSGWVD